MRCDRWAVCVVQLVDDGHVGEVDPRVSILLLIVALYWLLLEGRGWEGLQEDGPGLTQIGEWMPPEGQKTSPLPVRHPLSPLCPLRHGGKRRAGRVGKPGEWKWPAAQVQCQGPQNLPACDGTGDAGRGMK